MESFESKLNSSKKSLKNIRGYLWERKHQKKTYRIRRINLKRKLLERSKLSQKNFKAKKILWRSIKFLSKIIKRYR